MFRYVFFYSVLLVSLGTNQVVAEPQPRFLTAVKVTGSELYNQTVCLKRDDKGTCSKAGLVVEQTTGVADMMEKGDATFFREKGSVPFLFIPRR